MDGRFSNEHMMAKQIFIGIGTLMSQDSGMCPVNSGLVLTKYMNSRRLRPIHCDLIWKISMELNDASLNYTLNFDNYIGNAGDSFSYHKGNRFATFDNDHNGCSVAYSGAWWYNLCLYSNLNGLYNSTEFGKGINWNH
ncbi:hypothetical protein KUTeg_006646 [Tegillarca granosa]|uniref:Fibrinogen C-terminal domain-containing protein n=1 Tax=Tegillarca granosa TaxID=220873 RepID=A0ABQ9FAZ6_TEGGR|nr:hypothetical protein KUTeg_006646 [Tegillarca granosa]